MEAEITEVWPVAVLRLRCAASDLELRPATDTDAVRLGAIIHQFPLGERHFTPGLSSRIGATAVDTSRNFLQRTWVNRGELCREKWSIPFAVVRNGEVVGMQAIMADYFPTEGVVRSGSFLAPAARRGGIGTTMRAMVIEFAVGVLGAARMQTGYVEGNDASRTISERLGYRPVEESLEDFEGRPYRRVRMELTADEWAMRREAWVSGFECSGVVDLLRR